jgi:hypothetical protein
MTPDDSKAKCKRNRDNWKRRAIAAEQRLAEWRDVAAGLLSQRTRSSAISAYRTLIERETNNQQEDKP